MRAERWLGVVVGTWLASGCRLVAPSPEIRDVEPAWAFTLEDTPLQIVGEDLLPGLRASARDEGEVVDGYRVVLDAEGEEVAELVGVRLASTTLLEGIVPQGVPVGSYALRVVSPYGQEVVWGEPFDVRDTRADRLSIEVERVSYVVYELAELQVRLLDPFGVPIAQDLEVEVVLDDAGGGGVDAEFIPGGLEGQQVLTDAVGVRGRLGSDGEATLSVVVRAAATVQVTARPAAEDDPVDADDVLIQYQSGTAALVQIDLPSTPYTAEAGVPFDAEVTLLDAAGNPLPDVAMVVAFGDSCSSWAAISEVRGRTRIPWVPRRASGRADCPEMRIRVTSAGLAGESEPFGVVAGPVAGFEVAISPRVLTAGDVLNTFVRPVDQYGNEALWSGRVASVQDSAGGVVSSRCTETSPSYCAVQVSRVGSGLVLAVADEAGIVGASPTYDVAPGRPERLTAVTDGAVWEAGTPEVVEVGVEDAWGNPLPPALLDPASMEVTGGGDPVTCLALTPGAVTLPLSCTLRRAEEGVLLDVTEPTIPVGASVGPLTVINGPLYEVIVSPSATTTVAGAGLPVRVETWDAWGNPWVARGTSAVELSDTTGSLSPRLSTLGADGSAEVEVVITRKGLTRVEARVAGVTGVSPQITVDAGPAERLAVLLTAPWVWVGDTADLVVNAVDGFDNVVNDVFGEVRLAADSGVPTSTTATLVNGTGRATMSWTQTALNDVVRADGVGLAGSSRFVSAVRACGSIGPVADLRFSGATSARVCAPGAGSVTTVPASLSGSAPSGGMTLSLYAAVVDGGAPVSGASPSLLLPVARQGALDVLALVVQSDGCGAEARGRIYSGPDDGEPVGEIPLVTQQPQISLGPGGGAARVVVQRALTCRGVPAAGGTVWVRADRGAVSGASRTGSGLAVTLDATGSATLFLDATVARHAGLATMTVGVPSATATGRAQVELVGDLRSPYVWWQDPKGGGHGGVDLVTVRFSEALDPATVVPAAISVTGVGAPSVAGVALVGDGDVLEVALDGVAAEGAALQLQLAGSIADADGNLLAGTWGAGGVGYSGPFGVLASVAPIAACQASLASFHPDGDDGAGEQADVFDLGWSAVTQPAWWVVSVLDAAGALLRQEHLRPNGASDVWYWDGRGGDGAVLPAGAYTIEVLPEDALGNAGVGCREVIDLDLWEAP